MEPQTELFRGPTLSFFLQMETCHYDLIKTTSRIASRFIADWSAKFATRLGSTYESSQDIYVPAGAEKGNTREQLGGASHRRREGGQGYKEHSGRRTDLV